MGKYLVTAGLPYSNGRLHVGHIAGCYLPADIWVRYLRMCGHDVRYICGSDDHGVAIMLTADKEGKTPREVASYYNQKQQMAFKGLGIEFDIYGSTSGTKFHKEMSQHFFLRMQEKGLFEKRRTRQFYDESKEMFLPDRFVKGECGFCGTKDQNGDQCENCGKILDVDSLKSAYSTMSGGAATVKETVHWFLDLSKFRPEVEAWLARAEMRENTKAYVQSLINNGLVTRSMTRDIEWGIPLPIDDPEAKGKVLYVWFDAPIGYISNTMEMCEQECGHAERYSDWWKSKETKIFHFIGEDNTIFHCLIWIAMLSAEGSLSLPEGVVVNQFLNIQFPDKSEVEKISKSRGTAIWIEDYLSEGGDPDILRYYLTSIAPERARTIYKPDDLIAKNNADLANVLGNFVNRVLSFNLKYVGAEVPAYDKAKVGELDRLFESELLATHKRVGEAFDNYSSKMALQHIMDFARACNKYIDDKKPWSTRKDDMETTKVTLYYGIRAIHFLTLALSPFMPKKTQEMAKMLDLKLEEQKWSDAVRELVPGKLLGTPGILFQKIDEI
ncbi:MAG: methionine--tRNA ligase [Oligoflexia bacterium]|nr:methionine--tRNA ligase [Oligoflexia bacterium]MBF0364625.1 methionine--tRNA ligase [Oligoflexia bacterium]